MATRRPPLANGNFVGMTCAADYSAKQYYLVYQSSDTEVTVCTAITDIVFGVIHTIDDANGLYATIAVAPEEVWVYAAAALAVGAIVGPSTTGTAQAAVSTQFGCGRVTGASGAAADLVKIKLAVPDTVAIA
jgi:hypothetical protein